jgi:CRISP-associated protein Cas1
MRLTELKLLPRVADGLTFLYVERVRIELDQSSLVVIDDTGRAAVPVAALSVLLLGPGTSLTHAAMVACADSGCSVAFTGEGGVRLYASGMGESSRSKNLLDQARVWADPALHIEVVRRMYRMRFADGLDDGLTLDQIRGKEGVRVRQAYAALSKETGIAWAGRAYDGSWTSSTPVNRALSTANACLYGLCHAAIVATGLSPGLGFVHTGKSLAFVYDVADLYKVDTTLPIAFRESVGPLSGLESRVRRAYRDAFRRTKLLARIVPDIQRCLGILPERTQVIDLAEIEPEIDEPAPALWDPDGDMPGAHNYGDA